MIFKKKRREKLNVKQFILICDIYIDRTDRSMKKKIAAENKKGKKESKRATK